MASNDNIFVGKNRVALTAELKAGVDMSIYECEKFIKERECWKLATIIRHGVGADEDWDWQMNYNDILIKAEKLERQVWVSIKNQNWVLTEPFRKKYREMADEAMESMEVGVAKGFMPEDEYITSANTFKDAIEELEKVSGTIKMFYGVIPLDPAKILGWWGVGSIGRMGRA